MQGVQGCLFWTLTRVRDTSYSDVPSHPAHYRMWLACKGWAEIAVASTNLAQQLAVEADPIQRCDIVSRLAIGFLKQYPASTNSDCWDHVVYVGRSHALFIRSHEKRVTFRPRPCSPPKTVTRHQFAKRMFFIRRARLDKSVT